MTTLSRGWNSRSVAPLVVAVAGMIVLKLTLYPDAFASLEVLVGAGAIGLALSWVFEFALDRR